LTCKSQKSKKICSYKKKAYLCGQEEIVIGAEELKAGIYVYTLIVDGALVDTKQMILTK
jgi:hypothetical protein